MITTLVILTIALIVIGIVMTALLFAIIGFAVISTGECAVYDGAGNKMAKRAGTSKKAKKTRAKAK